MFSEFSHWETLLRTIVTEEPVVSSPTDYRVSVGTVVCRGPWGPLFSGLVTGDLIPGTRLWTVSGRLDSVGLVLRSPSLGVWSLSI